MVHWKLNSSIQDNHKACLDLWNRIMGMRQQITYSQNATEQVQILQMITNAPLYVTNQSLPDDLKVPFIKDVSKKKV
jgi:hypothetical protein